MKLRKNFDSTYIIFASAYTALVVASNLIFQKFLLLTSYNGHDLSISAGLIAFPATFLITDIISEIYGKKAANTMVWTAFLGFLLVMAVIKIADILPATNWSPINNNEFSKMFGYVDAAYLSSFISSLIAQLLDISIFHYLQNKTEGKHLWLRNNLSTIISQLIDTALVLSILFYFGVISQEVMLPLFINSYIYKFLFALADTPFIYLFVHLLRKNIYEEKKYIKIA